MSRIESTHLRAAAAHAAEALQAPDASKADEPWQPAILAGAPESLPMSNPRATVAPMPPETLLPMSPDNGRAVGHAMQLLSTAQALSTQTLALTSLRTLEVQQSKKHDNRREHKAPASHRRSLRVDGFLGDEEAADAMPILSIADAVQGGYADERTTHAAQSILKHAADLLLTSVVSPRSLGRIRP